MSATAHDLLGKVVLGRYRVLRHLADGGMGSIYLARNEGAAGFVRPVVVKVLLPGLVADARMVEMFMREARIMSTLRHPSIVSVLDFAQERDMHVMVLDYVHGFHLGRWHRFIAKTRGPFPVDIAVHVMMQVLRALSYAHNLKGSDGRLLNIVHRDVTPSNILIDVDGHTKLADFGIARMNTDKTEVGKHAIKGKFPYLAPEVIEGADPAAATDIYSVGVTLHELLIGRNEFRGPNIAAVIGRVMNHVPTRISDRRADVSPALSDIVARALAKDRADRFQSAAELADALSAIQPSSENEASRRLAELATADFHDPRMAEVLSVPTLDDLESSWATPTPVSASGIQPTRAPPADTSDDESDGGFASDDSDVVIEVQQRPAADPSHQAETVAMTPQASAAAVAVARHHAPGPSQAAPTSAPVRRVPWGPIAMGLGLVVVGAIGVIALLQSRQQAAPEPAGYVVVDQRVRVDAGVAAETDASTAAATDATAAGPDVAIDAGTRRPTRDAGAARPPDTAKDLTRAFGKQKARVQACFEQHAGNADGTTDLAVRFHVESDGRVVSAELIPASLAATPLGTCLLVIARSTRFGPLDKPMTFRVPLHARVKP